jgi:glucose-1-phosphate adenylyltransferase
MSQMLAVILGGGAGSRLFPLTKDRAKPAVPLAGKYRLIDVPISNCINSGLYRMFVLTQYNSASLNSHISHSYVFDRFHGGFVTILAAEQTASSELWYQGTADAVRQSMPHIAACRTTGSSSSPATSSTRWTTARCWRTTTPRAPTSPSPPRR